MDKIDSGLLESIADLHEVPAGAYNIRKNGEGHSRHSTANIEIVSKTDVYSAYCAFCAFFND